MKCPFAEWRPLPENLNADIIVPRVVILHTAVSTAESLFGFFGAIEETKESHFYVRSDGYIEQYMDTERQADANRLANDFAISVENQDNARNPILPMTAAQLNSNIRLFRWCSDVHATIKRQKCERWDGSGYGYHSMWGAPSSWTPVAGKTCPSPARIEQFETVMLPALTSTPPIPQGESDMIQGYDKSPEDEARAFIRDKCEEKWGRLADGTLKMTAADQNYLLGEWAKNGREKMMTLLCDHPKAK